VNTSNALAVERPEATTWPVERPTSGGTHARPLGRVAVSADVSCGLGSLLTALTLAGMILPETNPGVLGGRGDGRAGNGGLASRP
jgi:hypothetical protein